MAATAEVEKLKQVWITLNDKKTAAEQAKAQEEEKYKQLCAEEATLNAEEERLRGTMDECWEKENEEIAQLCETHSRRLELRELLSDNREKLQIVSKSKMDQSKVCAAHAMSREAVRSATIEVKEAWNDYHETALDELNPRFNTKMLEVLDTARKVEDFKSMGVKMALDAMGDKLFAGRVRIVTTPPSRRHRLAAAIVKPDDMQLAQDWMKHVNAMMEELEEMHSSFANLSIANLAQLGDEDEDKDEGEGEDEDEDAEKAA